MRAKVYPTHLLLIALAAMPMLHFIWPGAVLVPAPWSLSGLLPLAGGILLNLAADADLRRAGTTVKPGEESAALVAGGAYRISRNPMYLSFVAILAGVALLLGSLSPWIAVPVFAMWIDRKYVSAKERSLSSRFGPAWKTYASHVRRWI